MKFNILGTGSYLPDIVVTNQDMEGLVETSDEWIQSRTGIVTRHYTSGESAWYMGLQAARRALDMAGVDAQQLDAIVVTSVTPDYMCPIIGCILQHELGAEHAFAMDINVACSGFIYALDLAANYLNNPRYEHILVVGTEVLTCRTNFEDRNTCVLFGDAASAAVIGKAGDGELWSVILGADGSGGPHLISGNNRPNHPFLPKDWETNWPNRLGRDSTDIYMNGAEIYRFAVQKMPEMIHQMTAEAGCSAEDIDYMIPHQANTRILEAAARRLHYPMDRVYTGIERIGNTSSAGLGVGLDECMRGAVIKRGDLVALTGFGGGLTYGALLLKI